MVSVYESLLSKFLNDRSSLSKFHSSKLVANDDESECYINGVGKKMNVRPLDHLEA